MFVSVLACIAVIVATGVSAAPVEMHGIYEASFTSSRAYENASQDVEAAVEFVSPSGKRATTDMFWDGGGVWRVRFSSDETGTWRWTSRCSDALNAGLHGRSGSFECKPYRGSNPLRLHGPLKLSATRRYLAHADGTPFFWLADTAWNGVLKAKPDDWEKYLSSRRKQGFTAVQFVSTPWRSFDVDSHGETAFTGTEDFRINPGFFRRLDGRVQAINSHGMVAAPVVLWAVGKSDPGQALSEKNAIRLSKYIVARWGAHNVVWMLGGDGNYGGERAGRWKTIGRAVFGDRPARLATMHPGGLQWPVEEFRREAWYSIAGYQSGHGDSARAVRWLVEGPPATEWDRRPALPFINLEPNYEAILAYESKKAHNALSVRKALYRSLLISPASGVTYGHHAIWFWTDTPMVPAKHPGSGIAIAWHEAVESEGAGSVRHLAGLFNSIRWWTLRPDASLVLNRPDDPLRFIASARSDDGALAMVYLPEGGAVKLNTSKLKPGSRLRWFDPATGAFTSAGEITAGDLQLTAPGQGDCVLLIGDSDERGAGWPRTTRNESEERQCL